MHLRIPDEAKRSSGTARKCRANMADVLSVVGADVGVSWFDPSVIYKPGERIYCREPFDDDRWNECSSGIHFFYYT